jgi:hypothetical protein
MDLGRLTITAAERRSSFGPSMRITTTITVTFTVTFMAVAATVTDLDPL